MPRRIRATNPFYVLLILVGIAFVVTTFAYALFAFGTVGGHVALGHADEAVDSAKTSIPAPRDRTHPLWRLLSRHGNTIILVELVLLVTFALAAMATDSFWQRRERQE